MNGYQTTGYTHKLNLNKVMFLYGWALNKSQRYKYIQVILDVMPCQLTFWWKIWVYYVGKDEWRASRCGRVMH